jgi:hypothetical protein
VSEEKKLCNLSIKAALDLTKKHAKKEDVGLIDEFSPCGGCSFKICQHKDNDGLSSLLLHRCVSISQRRFLIACCCFCLFSCSIAWFCFADFLVGAVLLLSLVCFFSLVGTAESKTELDIVITAKDQLIASKESEIKSKESEIKSKESEIKTKDERIKELQNRLEPTRFVFRFPRLSSF